MRALLTFSVVISAVVALGSGCPKAVDCGGLSSDPPDVADGKGTATRSDGADFNEAASWEPGGLASVTVGALDMKIAKDGTGSDFDQLVGDGAFPICIPQSEQSDKSGAANLVDANSFVTDASHTGNVLIIDVTGDKMLGRFKVDLVSADGSSTLSFTDGSFNATRR